jgi:tetratricopeptide (TPR) repeat protein
VLAVYAGSLHAPFVFDDVPSIVENGNLESLWSARAFRSPEHVESSFAGRPLASYTLAWSHALSGRAPWGYHLVNLLLHGANAALLLALLRATLRRGPLGERLEADVPRLAFAGAALWAVHPLASEAVIFTSARSELLFSLFLLTALLAAARGFESAGRASRAWSALAVGAGLLGVLCKEVMAVAPVAVLLYDRSFLAGGFAAALRRRPGLYAGLAATWLPVAAVVLSQPRGKTVGIDLGLSPIQYLFTQASIVLHYLRLAVWPAPLQFLYDWPPAITLRDALPELAVVSGLALATLIGLWRRPVAAFPLAWFFLVLAPTSSVVPIVSELVAEKRMYLPLAALVPAAVVALHLAASALAERSARRRAVRALEGAALAALGVALALGTAARARVWSSERSLWEDTAAKAPLHPWVNNNLGIVYLRAGELDRAEGLFRAALARRPALATAWVNLGNVRMARGDPAGAVDAYRRGLEERPDAHEVHYNLGLGLARLGQRDAAIGHWEEAVRLLPRHRSAHVGLARAYAQRADWPRAIEHQRAAIELDPAEAAAHVDLAEWLVEAGDLPGAIDAYRKALALEGGNLRARVGLAGAEALERQRD